MKKYLVAYASKHGATAEIAQSIAQTLRKNGNEAEALRAGSVRDVSVYDGIVIGSAMYIGLWRGEAVRFIKKNKERLLKMPVWIFISGPTGEGDPSEMLKGAYYPKSLRPVIEGISPRGVTAFKGRVDNSTLSPFDKWIVRNVKAPEGDFRDWEAIDSWAASITMQ